MSTRNLTRAFLSTAKPMNAIISHSYTTAASSSSSALIPKPSFIFRLRPLAAAASSSGFRRLSPALSSRGFSTRPTSSSLNDPNPNWSNRPPKETILLDGCDFEHWLVVVEKPEGDVTRDDIIDGYIKTLATVVGSEEEARMKIYSVSTRCYFAFGALVSEELSYKLKELPNVRWVLPDSYLDVRNKDYGGEPFINGEAVPYHPKYHEEWERNNARANDRNRRNDRPRNHDRPRTQDRRRDMQNTGGSPTTNFTPQNSNPSGNYPPRGPPANNNSPNYQHGPSGPGPYQPGPSGPGPYQPGPGQMVPAQGQNHNNAYPPYQGQNVPAQPPNRGYDQGPNVGGYAPNSGHAPGPNQNYAQSQNGYGPNVGPGQGQNQGGYGVGPGQGQNQGGYGSQNVPGRDSNY